MALIQSKQFNPKFTGSFVISGSKPSDGSYRANLEVIGGLKSDDVVLNEVTASGDINVGGDLNVSQYIKHKDDSNTYLNFTDDRLRFNIGGISYIDLNDSTAAPHDITFNDGGNNVDLTIKGTSNNPLFKTDASAGRIGTNGIGTPLAGLHLGDTLLVNSHITASANISSSATITALQYGGNVSGSATSTGSFGKIKLNDDTHLNAGTFAISGSSVSTASFGMVKIHAIEGASPITFNDTIIENKNLEVVGQITASSHISASGNLSVTGNVDFDGNLDVDGISNLDNTDIDGTLTVNGTNTTITSPIISMVGAVTASSHISASGNLNIGGNIVTVGDITTQGNIVAKTFIVSSSVSHFTQSFSSGSTIFGDDSGDTHEVTGSLLVTGSLNVQKGRIFEQGTSVIDHATAMAIVFGG